MTEAGKLPTQKNPLKILTLFGAGLALAIALTWISAILYWHWQIRTAISNLEILHSTPAAAFAYHDLVNLRAKPDHLYTAGCRALPYLIEALNSSKDSKFQRDVMQRILTALAGPGPYDDQTFTALEDRESRYLFIAEGFDFEREQKISDFNAWWKGNGARYHQGWRIWSSWCPGEQR